MRHLLGLLILLFVVGLGVAKLRSMRMAYLRQRRAATRGMRIGIPGDGSTDQPTDLKED